jgi:hypothetical protein
MPSRKKKRPAAKRPARPRPSRDTVARRAISPKSSGGGQPLPIWGENSGPEKDWRPGVHVAPFLTAGGELMLVVIDAWRIGRELVVVREVEHSLINRFPRLRRGGKRLDLGYATPAYLAIMKQGDTWTRGIHRLPWKETLFDEEPARRRYIAVDGCGRLVGQEWGMPGGERLSDAQRERLREKLEQADPIVRPAPKEILR